MNNLPVAGIDIGKNFSEMAILKPNNEVYKRMKILHQCTDNLNKAIELLKSAEKELQAKPVIVMEATGHYHRLLFYLLKNNGYEVSVVNPIQTDSIKNIGVRKVKNDKVDAIRIALLYRFKELKLTNIPNEDIECLRSLCREYHNLVDDRTAYKNRLASVIDQIMLNFTDVFDDICGDTALAVLEKYPTPAYLLEADMTILVKLMAETSRKNLSWATKKYESLIEKASAFKDVSISNVANVTMLKNYITLIKGFDKAIDGLLANIHCLITKDESKEAPQLAVLIKLLCTIPGISEITAATIVAEIGDFSAFSNPKKLTAFFGIDASVCQSGQFNGTENHISKRGSRLLRRVLFNVALANIRTKSNGDKMNPVMYEYYIAKCVNKAKKVALVAVMHKLVFVIFAVLRDKKPFELRDPKEHAKMLKNQSLQQFEKSA